MTSYSKRPALDLAHPESDVAVEQLIASLQAGFDAGDADSYDSTFADDVLWGTPKGQWLAGFHDLNGAHNRMMRGEPAEPRSRFELLQKIRPADGVVVAQIRRTALNGGFSEVAMYVLVRCEGGWWLAAAQNTPVTDTLPTAAPS